ncbi:MAG: hypothetical protein ACP6IQ_09875 [Candidatus Njordarchaeia archaeon]
MLKLKGNIIKFDPKFKKISFMPKTSDSEAKKEPLELKVTDPQLWAFIKGLSGDVEIEFQDDKEKVLTNIRGRIYTVIHGVSKKFQKTLEESGEMASFVAERVPLVGILGSFIGSGSELDLLIIALMLFLGILLLVYYLILIPILIAILSIFTLGESWFMMKRKIYYLEVEYRDPTLKERIKGILKIILGNKSAIEGIPEFLIPENYKSFHNELLRIYNNFWKGIIIQGLTLIVAGLTFAVPWLLHMELPINSLYLEVIFGSIFAVGFIMSVYYIWRRKLIEVPGSILYL